MDELARQAIAATQSLQRSAGYRSLPPGERAELDDSLQRINAALSGQRPPRASSQQSSDPYAVPLATPADLRTGPGPAASNGRSNGSPASPTSPPPARPTGTEVLGDRARRALDAVDFPSFIAELIQGTFQAIVDATAQQVREYARLVSDISKSVDEFTRDNVSTNQARDWLVARHPRDLELLLPEPGEQQQPRLEPRKEAPESPEWLVGYELGGSSLTPELVEGPLLDRARRGLAEERLRTLATMVLMGINRIVIDDGQLRAKLQFHAHAREKVSAEAVTASVAQSQGLASRQAGMAAAVSTMVSTADVNAQADVSLRADLVGEIYLRFRTETFDLQNFADSDAIGFIRRHSQTRNIGTEAPASSATPGTPPPPPEPGRDGA